MRFVFSPWRLDYVTSDKAKGGCVFCAAFEQEPSPDNLVLYRDERLAVMLNRYPYTNGHLMVIPKPHVDSLTGLDPEGRAGAAEALTFCEGLLRRIYRAEGINVGLNLGQAGGAGIKDHIHWHILPRWTGDTNFITVCGETRILPEDLSATFDRLRPEFPTRIE